ncbi:hypothetical protein AB6802_25530 [Mesorhizobium sp. RCC_202]|uniref:hypothetical protein n=1 Tax=Mesorhizobium sp. RCC_202 TaxID=3239222 RepID=UPI00352368FE
MADALARFGRNPIVFMPLHVGLLLPRTSGACPEDQRTRLFIPGRRIFSLTLM